MVGPNTYTKPVPPSNINTDIKRQPNNKPDPLPLSPILRNDDDKPSALPAHYEIFTSDPSTLSDQYLYGVRERLATGKQYQSDYKYAKEANTRFGEQSVSDVPKGRGVVYLRIDKTPGGLKPYIGQAQSVSRYLERQKEHTRANPDADFVFQIIVTGVPGNDLTRKEQRAIDAFGGVTNKKNPNGGTSNQRNPGKSLPKQDNNGGN